MTDDRNLLNNRYQLVETLGKGGMAVVFKGRDRMLERDVAIKILKREYSRDQAFRERFRQEAMAAANLSHTNIVTVFDFGFDNDRLFIVMEYVPGKDLNTIIEERGRLSVRYGIDLIIKACKGIGYAHRAGLVHCDVKPHNFLVSADHQLKVTDFGIARALASINPEEESEVVWGSPQYFSPEQAIGGAPSPASDVYSLGVVMYKTFTGQLPFIGKTSSELARMHRRATPIPPTEINPFIPQELEEVIHKVLSKEPSARYRTADQLGRVLLTIQGRMIEGPPEESPPAPLPLPESKPNPVTRTRPRTGEQQAYKEDTPVPSMDEAEEASALVEIDWVAVGLGLLAFTSVVGLLPFYIWVFSVFNPPIP